MYIAKLKQLERLYIKDNNTTYIGGNQHWFEDYRMVFGGCASVAASNILLYLSFSASYTSPFKKTPINQKNFVEFCKKAYDALKPFHCYDCKDKAQLKTLKFFNSKLIIPPSLGIATTFQFKRGMCHFAKQMGIVLKNSSLKKNDYSEWVDFISLHLSKEHPIALLNTIKSVEMTCCYIDKPHQTKQVFAKHWVVISAIEKNLDHHQIEVLTWGGIGKVNLYNLWEKDHALVGLNTHFIAYSIDESII